MLENKVKGIERAKGLFFSIIGEKRSKSLLASIIRKKYGGSFKFPLDITSIKNILIITPENELEVIFQLKNIISLMNLFKYAGLTLVCERSISSYLRMIPGLNIIEYDKIESQYLLSSYLTKEIGENIDICFLLSTNPSLQMLYFAGLCGAPLRICLLYTS
ncbi:MAG: hypothetical protein N2053_10175, partial [Chitinispirillaceae bacterium]|nr:hypothetical protein [Chitinispirillaceae bacterium]